MVEYSVHVHSALASFCILRLLIQLVIGDDFPYFERETFKSREDEI